jgi:hypothetical protein
MATGTSFHPGFIRWGRDHGAGDGAITTAAAVPLRLT